MILRAYDSENLILDRKRELEFYLYMIDSNLKNIPC